MKLTVYEDGRVCPKEAPVPSFLEDEVLFRVKACGICGSDLPRVFSGKAYYYPIVLGHEFSGVVEDAADSSLVGGRYCVFPILPCGKCEFCRREQYANCVHYDYYGLFARRKKSRYPQGRHGADLRGRDHRDALRNVGAHDGSRRNSFL